MDDKCAPGFVADDAILFGLNGGDDVAHAASAFRGDGREESTLALEARLVLIRVKKRAVENVVLNVHDGAPRRHEMAAKPHPARALGRCLIKRGGGRCAPINEKLCAFGGEHTDAADVVPAGVGPIEPAKNGV